MPPRANQRFGRFSTHHLYCSDHLTATVIRIVLLRSTSPAKNWLHQTLHMPTEVSAKIERRAPRASWSPADAIADVITTMSASTSALANVIRLRHQVDFCNLGAPYSVFRVDFIFAVHFCIFCFKMKNKDKSSSFCNNRRRQSNKHFCNFYKRFGHNIETCY